MSYRANNQVLNPEDYWAPEFYRSEMQLIAERVWSYACLTRDIPGHNDYVTLSVGSRSVIVQNFDGTIKAFDNVCSHRGCRIRTEATGNGIIRCPYHSWTYNSIGMPVGVPSAELAFQLTDADRAGLALVPWQVELCGDLVFIRRGAGGSNLREQLGDLYDELLRISVGLGPQVDSLESTYDANWKICVENTLDEYHARFVHPTTFRNLLSDQFSYEYEGWNSTMRVPASETYLAKWRKINRLLKNRAIDTEDYFHYILFPNTTIASSFGASFSIQRIVPVGPQQTLLSSRLFLGASTAPQAVTATIGDAAAQFNKTVFEEDRVVCNQMQAGIREATRRALLGKFEQRILHFQTSLKEMMVQAQADVPDAAAVHEASLRRTA